MLNHLSELKKASLFYFIVMALSLALVIFFRLVAPESDIVVLANMLTPALATVIMLYVLTSDGYKRKSPFSLGLTRSGWHSWGLALLLPLVVLALTYGLGWWSGAAEFVAPTGTDWLPNLIINLLINLLVIVPLVVGEEIGFRGYFLPRLRELGSTKAVLISGFLHGTWHLPLIFLTSFYLTEGNRLLTIPLFLMLLTASGVMSGVLRLTTDSLWPSVVLHATFNAFLGVFATLTAASSPLSIYIIGESGVLTLVVAAGVAFWFLRRWFNKRSANLVKPALAE
jgi:membrane protease YdiL (CAAX protease family)